MSAQRRLQLVAAAKADDVLIVADEVYHLLRFAPGPMPPPMSAYRRRWADAVDRHVLQDPRSRDAPRLDSRFDAAPRRTGGLRADPQRGRAQPGHVEPGDGDDADGLAAGVRRVAASHVRPAIGDDGRRSCAQHMPDWVEYDVPAGGYFVWLRLPPGADGGGAARRSPNNTASTCVTARSSRRPARWAITSG